MKILTRLSLAVLLLAQIASAQNQARLYVHKSAERKTSIDLSSLRTGSDSASQTFKKTLKRDLQLSGWFSTQKGSGSELSLGGTVSPSGGKIKAITKIIRTADKAPIFNKGYSINSQSARTLAHRVADDIIEAITGHKGICSTKIAVVGTRTGQKELYLCDADGGGVKQLTNDRKIVIGPNWSKDGNTLVFTSFLRGFPDVYRVNLRSGRRERISSYGGLNTGSSLSPNGQELALILSKDGNPELYVRNLRTGQLRRLTKTSRAAEASPCWSPDGRQIVYVSDQSSSPQLYIISREGGTPKRISRRGSQNVAPDWGTNNLITCSSRSGGIYSIAIIDPTTGQTNYLKTDGANYEDPSWAPDERHIVASRSKNYRTSLYLLDTISDPPVLLLEGGGNWLMPAWSPK